MGTDVPATTTISTDTTWTLVGSPYRLFFDGTKRPTIAAGATLTIESGVKIVPQGGGYTALEIQGTLNAVATSGAPIIFTSINDADDLASTTPQKGDWLNIAFSTGSQGNLDYVEFHYGGQGLERPVKEMIKAVGSTVNINHSTFTNSQSIALRLVDSNGVVENSTFSDNTCGISVDSLVNSDGTTNGGCAGSSGYFPAVATTTPQIRNNQFIRNNLIAVEVRNGATPIIDNNIFIDNGYPVRIESSYPVITNSQIANSTTSPNILNGIAIDGYTHFRKNYTLKKDLPYILE
ncbi:MAG: right-handed parallel beta-helix repeat-containing protein, partial [Patescibacteria group bacterium]